MSSARDVDSLPFTGERVVPGAVEPDLWNEHVSRYHFASHFALQRRVIDLGCGAGYGTELLAASALHAVGLDNSPEAIAFACSQFSKPEFLTGSVTDLPFPAASFSLATAFEVIEHLEAWPRLLEEVDRILTPDGIFLVSTPNRIAYSEARGDAGGNPFHVHEFDLDEFERALSRHFPFVRVLSQNHQAAVVFSGEEAVSVESLLAPKAASTESEFFFAVCARKSVTVPAFVFLPEAASVLREREQHIRLLQARVSSLEGDLTSLMQAHRKVQDELEDHNAWALDLDKDLIRAREQLNRYDQELTAAGAASSALHATLHSSQVTQETLRAELVALQTALAQSQQAFESSQASLATSQGTLEVSQAALAALRGDFEGSQEAAASSKAEATAMQARVETAESERLAFEIRLQAAQKHNDNLVAEEARIRNSAWVRLGSTLRVGPGSNRRRRLKPALKAARQRWFRLRQKAIDLCNQSLRLLKPVEPVALYLIAPLLLLASTAAMLALDLSFRLFGRRRLPSSSCPRHQSASIVIPNWNGRDLLARFLPALLSEVGSSPGNEIIVVDNASSDGSPDFIRREFPGVRLLELPENRGFAGACNAGARAAENEVVVMLNNDMKVGPGFLAPLLQHFHDPEIFAVSSQIFFSDPQRRREETGLTETWWKDGFVAVGHRVDPEINVAYPCAYPGGGSSAFDRKKFLELGGFDSLFHPFYYEDTDLGRLAWKRGWKILYEPASIVFHEHRGTIGRVFSTEYIESVLRKNAIVYCWKNIHDWRLLASNIGACLASTLSQGGKEAARRCAPPDALLVFRHLRGALRSRWSALATRAISDREAFNRPLGGYFHDRFVARSLPVPSRLNVLFLSPYPIEPPTHGGAVFMKEALGPLAAIADIHLLSFVDTEEQLPAQNTLVPLCKTTQFTVRPHFRIEGLWTLTPCAIQEFGVRDFAWRIHRTIYLQKIDVLQIEYTILGQYNGQFRHLPSFLFEHDISVQSLKRRVATSRFDGKLLGEYLRMRLYEPRLLKRFSKVQVCSDENARYLLQLVPSLRGRIDSKSRAAIDTRRYEFTSARRLPDTLLFVGSFRHSPNLDALRWFTEEVFPTILVERPSVVLYIVGSDSPQSSTIWNEHKNIRLLGSVSDIKEPFSRYAVFICPVISGSGVRVKLLEAFASGIPAVSTRVGAEGLARVSGEVCELADSAGDFAASVLRLLSRPEYSVEMATRARQMMERDRDSGIATKRLESLYRSEVLRSRTSAEITEPGVSRAQSAT